jgi:hypothetical protein
VPAVAARAVQHCAEVLDDAVWLGCAAVVRGYATGELDQTGAYRRSVAMAEALTSRLDSGDALQACGMLHLLAAAAAGALGDHGTSATHLAEASALAARMDTEVSSWANLWFGGANVGIWRTSVALEVGEPGQALLAAKAVHPELLPKRNQVQFGLRSAAPCARGTRPGTRACACCCMPNSSPRNGSTTTCSSAKRSRACCASPGAMLGAVSCAVWLGGWESRRLGDTGRMQGEDPIARFSNSASQPRG